MKSPLRKRLPRELKSEFGKYLVVFIMMAITIGFVSGFLVADGSMLRAYDDSFQKYNIEDGYFQTKKKLTPAQKEDIEKSDVKVYENFYIEQKLTNGSTIRFFKNRKEVDKVCLMNGKMPKKSGEIAVDRMYADNNELKVGDTVKSRKKTFRITGLVALSDYSALFQNNNDTMFDAVKFGVAIVTDKDFEALNQVKVVFFAGGTGHPYFSTDTATALRAIEIEADAILLAKAIDGVYDSDPKVNPDAVKYDEISLDEVLSKKLGVIDLTATIMCLENKMPLVIFGLEEENSIVNTMSGNFNGTYVTV